MDAALIANDRLRSRMRDRKPGIMCKLDIAKAYDHVNWGFLLNVLVDLGFDRSSKNWI